MSWSNKFNIDHVREAASEWKVPREPVPPELLRETAKGGRCAPHFIQPGEKLGELTAIEVVGRSRDGSNIWICKCSCGGEVLRASNLLIQAVREGRKPCCRKCLEELSGGRFAVRRKALHEAFRKQYVDYRTLWTSSQTSMLMAGIRNDLEAEFGPMGEDDNDLQIPLHWAVGWPYSMADIVVESNRRARRGDADGDGAADRDVTERKRDELAAELMQALDSGDAERIDEANAAVTSAEIAADRITRKSPRYEPATYVPEAWAPYDGLRVCRCLNCRQRIAWRFSFGEQVCNTECGRLFKAQVERKLVEKRRRDRLRELTEEEHKREERSRKAREAQKMSAAVQKQRREEREEEYLKRKVEFREHLREARGVSAAEAVAKAKREGAQLAVLVPIDGLVLGQFVDRVQRQIKEEHGIETYYQKTVTVRGRTVVQFEDNELKPVYVIMLGVTDWDWVLGATSPGQAVDYWLTQRVVNGGRL